jgi:hypothetical protein
MKRRNFLATKWNIMKYKINRSTVIPLLRPVRNFCDSWPWQLTLRPSASFQQTLPLLRAENADKPVPSLCFMCLAQPLHLRSLCTQPCPVLYITATVCHSLSASRAPSMSLKAAWKPPYTECHYPLHGRKNTDVYICCFLQRGNKLMFPTRFFLSPALFAFFSLSAKCFVVVVVLFY